jgi:large subunit ribosomal protein L16
MLFPKKVKHRKWQTSRSNPKKDRVETRGITLAFGSYGLKATTPARVEAKQLESARKVLARSVNKVGRVWIRVFPDRPVTAKPSENPMGKGKGDPESFCFQVLPGRVLFEIDGVTPEVARESLRKAGTKLPVKTRFISRDEH